MQNQPGRRAEIDALEAQAKLASKAGRDDEAERLWYKLLEADPAHVRALIVNGQHAYRRGEMLTARTLFQRLVSGMGADCQAWINLALTCQALKDERGEEDAIRGALTADPGDLVALILRANLLEKQGHHHEAAWAHGAVATVAPPLERLVPNLRPAVKHAFAYKEKYDQDYGTFMDQYLAPHYQTFAGEKLDRFQDSLDILVSRKKRYDSKSMTYHYPRLVPFEFFERADFPWLDAIEEGTDAIRSEFLATLQQEEGFTPYLTYSSDVPHNQFAELNNSPRWSAFHLYKSGERVEPNATKCPTTMTLLDQAPQPDQPGRTPTAMFSLLKPHTRIPAHVGVSNARLVTHLPLIVPESCGFRVGNETREWSPGKAWVFDDTIEHEAWNDSDKLRVVLIFDIWHPHLTPPERAMITALTNGMNAFLGGAGGYEL